MPGAYFIVRAVVADPAERASFDRWYEDEHLRDAVSAFAARRGWRAWSETDPSVHCAYYEFDTVAAADAVVSSPALARLIADFEARWQGRVPRTREVLRVAGRIVDGAGATSNS